MKIQCGNQDSIIKHYGYVPVVFSPICGHENKGSLFQDETRPDAEDREPVSGISQTRFYSKSPLTLTLT